MTSILTLPSHMTGFLHELGTQSGIYRSVESGVIRTLSQGLSWFCFSYVSKPRRMCPAPGQGTELRRESRQLSLMSDRRVVRGNTYSGTISHRSSGIQVKRTTANTATNNNRSLPSARLSQLGREPLKGGGRRRDGGRGRLTVPPVAGRRHQTLQTEQWLEEISDKREEKEMATQVNLTDDWEQGGSHVTGSLQF